MIPAWNFQGVIPPVRPGVEGHLSDRSPYRSSLRTFIDLMGTSSARLNIVEGLLAFRQEIHKLGITSGFQWLNGSFSENIESTEGRDPRDIDVVTFFQLPSGEDQASIVKRNPQLFDPDFVKRTYRVDGYWEVLGVPLESRSVQRVSYWYSLWSHRRDGMWKGFVQVDLNSIEDASAMQALGQSRVEQGVLP